MSAPVFAQDSFGGQPQQQQQPAQQQQQQYPQQQGYPLQPQQGYPQQQQPQQGANGGGNLDQLMQMERQDYGVPASNQLHNGAMHGPTPASIPGGQLITTKGLSELVQGRQTPYFLFDVLGGPQTLPGAMPAAWMSQAGSFSDQTQQQISQMLQQGTQGRKDVPLIFYCMSTQCWMSYNAALRAIHAGYTNVLWYRGGIEAWQMAGFPTQPAQQQGGYQQ
ncbi:rhodanese-like domain-containing protein [Hyphococcus sp.]|uniref:rhodanese-like domain-containing protein n=1 Tax=Hyphococcus sp. TaxID=2038636 RepID=UPI0037517304